jgi:hypothetical protein
MGFFVKVFIIKENLVFMNNFYRKVAVTSVCTTLGFVLGASEEAKAATFTVPPTITFEVIDGGLGDYTYDGRGDKVFPGNFNTVVNYPTYAESGEFAEFNIGSFSVTPNTVINSAIFQAEILTFQVNGGVQNPGSLGIFGYVGNGTAETSDFEAGVFLTSIDISSSSPGDILNFDVTPFVNQQVSNSNAFGGFGIRALNPGALALANYEDRRPRLIVETAEPVPEPTTIFGSAIFLGVGGWLKRKKSTPQNKATAQH